MKKRSSRARLQRSRVNKVIETQMDPTNWDSMEDEDEDEEEYIPYVPPIEVIEPLYVFTATTLPKCAADADVPTTWYGCKYCIRVFRTAKERDSHKAVHKKSRSKPAPIEMSDNESSNEDPPHEDEKMESPESAETASQPEIPVVEAAHGSGFAGNAKSRKPSQVKSSNSHETSELQCNICTDTFSSRKDLKLHVIGHNLTKPEKAIHLGNKMGKRKSYDGGSSFEGDEAPYDDTDFPELKKRQTLACKSCGKAFGHEESLKRHAKTHVDKKEASGSSSKSAILGTEKTSMRTLSRLGRKPRGRVF